MGWSWQDYEDLPLSVLAVLRDELRDESREALSAAQQDMIEA